MPRWLVLALLVAVVVTWIPMALMVRARSVKTEKTRIHIIPDMDSQPKYRAQAANVLFRDGRAMRPPVEGTVARGELRDEDDVYRGKDGDAWVATIPMPVTMSMMERGQNRFEIFCAPCHGLAGYGDGMVNQRADALQEGTWTPPSSFHTELVRERPVGQLFNTITYGVRNMPAHGPQIEVADRWAIVAYVKALQRSQYASIDDVPEVARLQMGE
jgi:mono/diheme cytochrome c family protein